MLFRSIDPLQQNIDKSKDLCSLIELWVLKEGYTKQGITVTSFADELNTNRTYISNYINNKYKCNFRDWINSLRIENAKILMTENKDIIIEDVAESVGYISRSHFVKVFADNVGQTPSEWRNQLKS